jgi:hypothetical protein
MSLSLRPFLQHTQTRAKLLPVMEKQEAARQKAEINLWKKTTTQTKLGAITLLGGSEILGYALLTFLSKMFSIFSKEMQTKGVLYGRLLKGSTSATLITVYALGGTTRAQRLVIRVEATADQRFKKISLKSEAKFEKILDQTRKHRIAQYLKKNGNPAELLPATWDSQANEAKLKLATLILALKQEYPALPSTRKYTVLTEAEKSIRSLIRSINSFVLSKQDLGPL